MDTKLIVNNLKEIIEEIFFPRRAQRMLIRTARYASNAAHVELRTLLQNVDLVIDVGANEGQFYRSVRHALGYRGDVLSFEPNPDMYARLTQFRQQDPRLKTFDCALGAAAGSSTFNLYEDSKLSSFLQGDDTASTRFKGKFDKRREIVVPVKTLSAVLDELAFEKPRSIFLKLDTQGFDLEVYKGIGRYADQVQYLQTEFSVIPLYNNMPHFTTAIQFFEDAGYKILSLTPVTRDKQRGYVIEFDALWAKRV
jgi:FkbM family methyltransferase